MGNKKERSPEEVAADFATETSKVSMAVQAPDDDPEPDFLREAGLTTVGTVDPDAPRPAAATNQQPAAESPLAGLINSLMPGMSGIDVTKLTDTEKIMLMLVHGLQSIAAGQAHAQQTAAQALDNAARQQQPDNKFAPGISDFNPQGDLQHARPRLKCEMFLPWEAEADSLTFEEIELLNLLEEGEYTIKRNDGVKVVVTVRMTRNLNGNPNRLLMNSEVAFNEENHWMLPPLTSILRQVLHQRPHTRAAAEKVLTMDERFELVRNGQLPVSVGVR